MFDKAAAAARQRKQVQVIIRLNGEEPFDGSVFVKSDERLSDLLNDGRTFLPVRRADGPMLFVSKASIVSVIETPGRASKGAEDEVWRVKAAEFENGAGSGSSHPEEEDMTEAPKPAPRAGRKSLDPYEVLRVSRTATLEEIRKAYKARIKAVHPDTIAALDLDEDLERAANITAQKVNHAYHRIMCERERAKETTQSTEAGAA